MPLMPGGARRTIAENIATEIRAGRDAKQAAAIAYRKAGKYRPPRKKREG